MYCGGWNRFVEVVPFFFGKDNFTDALTVYVRVDGMTYSVRDNMVPYECHYACICRPHDYRPIITTQNKNECPSTLTPMLL